MEAARTTNVLRPNTVRSNVARSGAGLGGLAGVTFVAAGTQGTEVVQRIDPHVARAIDEMLAEGTITPWTAVMYGAVHKEAQTELGIQARRQIASYNWAPRTEERSERGYFEGVMTFGGNWYTANPLEGARQGFGLLGAALQTGWSAIWGD